MSDSSEESSSYESSSEESSSYESSSNETSSYSEEKKSDKPIPIPSVPSISAMPVPHAEVPQQPQQPPQEPEPPAPQVKPWERPWELSELRKEVKDEGWSLSSDAGLLNTLMKMSDDIMSQSKQLNDSVDELVYVTKNTEVKLHNTFNSFLNLAQYQFFENRVYDDETPTITNGSEPKKEEEKDTNAQAEVDTVIKSKFTEAISFAMRVLEKSTIKDEDDDAPQDPKENVKNHWSKRPLPFIIGTPDFSTDDYVGLFYEEESEEEVPNYYYQEGLPSNEPAQNPIVEEAPAPISNVLEPPKPNEEPESIQKEEKDVFSNKSEEDSWEDSQQEKKKNNVPPEPLDFQSQLAKAIAGQAEGKKAPKKTKDSEEESEESSEEDTSASDSEPEKKKKKRKTKEKKDKEGEEEKKKKIDKPKEPEELEPEEEGLFQDSPRGGEDLFPDSEDEKSKKKTQDIDDMFGSEESDDLFGEKKPKEKKKEVPKEKEKKKEEKKDDDEDFFNIDAGEKKLNDMMNLDDDDDLFGDDLFGDKPKKQEKKQEQKKQVAKLDDDFLFGEEPKEEVKPVEEKKEPKEDEKKEKTKKKKRRDEGEKVEKRKKKRDGEGQEKRRRRKNSKRDGGEEKKKRRKEKENKEETKAEPPKQFLNPFGNFKPPKPVDDEEEEQEEHVPIAPKFAPPPVNLADDQDDDWDEEDKVEKVEKEPKKKMILGPKLFPDSFVPGGQNQKTPPKTSGSIWDDEEEEQLPVSKAEPKPTPAKSSISLDFDSDDEIVPVVPKIEPKISAKKEEITKPAPKQEEPNTNTNKKSLDIFDEEEDLWGDSTKTTKVEPIKSVPAQSIETKKSFSFNEEEDDEPIIPKKDAPEKKQEIKKSMIDLSDEEDDKPVEEKPVEEKPVTKTTAKPGSKIAALSAGLKFNPQMMMGGGMPRPKKSEPREDSESSEQKDSKDDSKEKPGAPARRTKGAANRRLPKKFQKQRAAETIKETVPTDSSSKDGTATAALDALKSEGPKPNIIKRPGKPNRGVATPFVMGEAPKLRSTKQSNSKQEEQTKEEPKVDPPKQEVKKNAFSFDDSEEDDIFNTKKAEPKAEKKVEVKVEEKKEAKAEPKKQEEKKISFSLDNEDIFGDSGKGDILSSQKSKEPNASKTESKIEDKKPLQPEMKIKEQPKPKVEENEDIFTEKSEGIFGTVVEKKTIKPKPKANDNMDALFSGNFKDDLENIFSGSDSKKPTGVVFDDTEDFAFPKKPETDSKTNKSLEEDIFSTKKEEPKQVPKKEEPKQEPKKEVPKQEPKKEEPKKEAPKQEPKKEEPKQAPKKEEIKKDVPKKQEPKVEAKIPAAKTEPLSMDDIFAENDPKSPLAVRSAAKKPEQSTKPASDLDDIFSSVGNTKKQEGPKATANKNTGTQTKAPEKPIADLDDIFSSVSPKKEAGIPAKNPVAATKSQNIGDDIFSTKSSKPTNIEDDIFSSATKPKTTPMPKEPATKVDDIFATTQKKPAEKPKPVAAKQESTKADTDDIFNNSKPVEKPKPAAKPVSVDVDDIFSSVGKPAASKPQEKKSAEDDIFNSTTTSEPKKAVPVAKVEEKPKPAVATAAPKKESVAVKSSNDLDDIFGGQTQTKAPVSQAPTSPKPEAKTETKPAPKEEKKSNPDVDDIFGGQTQTKAPVSQAPTSPKPEVKSEIKPTPKQDNPPELKKAEPVITVSVSKPTAPLSSAVDDIFGEDILTSPSSTTKAKSNVDDLFGGEEDDFGDSNKGRRKKKKPAQTDIFGNPVGGGGDIFSDV